MREKTKAKNDAMKVILPNPFQTTTKQSNGRHRIEKNIENEDGAKRGMHCN